MSCNTAKRLVSRVVASKAIQNVGPPDCSEMLSDPDVVYLDVRTPEEYNAGHVNGAVLIPAFDRGPSGMAPNPEVVAAVKAQFPEKDTTLVVGCKVGGRSSAACNLLQAEGYTKLFNLTGGYDAWEAWSAAK